MSNLDTLILSGYIIVLLGMGFSLKKESAKDLDAYFLGGRKVKWIWLAMSGSVSNFDITGTMFICSLLFIMGMKSMWVHMMWGILMGAFFMSYMGRWVRSSEVFTAAEWMETRFGRDKGGRLARLMYAVMAIVTLTASVGYAFQGIGKFASIYLPFSPTVCAVLLISATTLYAMLGGLKGVVISDVIQTAILTISAIIISYIAWNHIGWEIENETLSLPNSWTDLTPGWKTDISGYEMFGFMVIAWTIKGFLLNLGGPGQMYDFQRFLAARSPAEGAKIGAAWSLFLIVRWPMCAGIALLALSGFQSQIQDPEQVMPLVFRDFLPDGIRGFVLTGFIAAFMSTFSSVINSGASFLVKDVWIEYIRPDATPGQQIKMSYLATMGIVFFGILCGLYAQSIAQIWGWIMMALGSGVIVPNVLRWYWWRLNGWGYGAGIISGMLASLVVLWFPELPVYWSFPLITGCSTMASVLISLITPATNDETLIRFFQTVRPFGHWSPVRKKCDAGSLQSFPHETGFNTLLNVFLGMIFICGIYMGPMYLIGHWYRFGFTFLALSLLSAIALYFTWYRRVILKLENSHDISKLSTTEKVPQRRVSHT